ncbi:hypothetical protein AMATHDRAFT_7881 [Amanita thiersii Skay4041]|uniref:RhoGAP-domain-containing protein n=1 Tax=Amanita thiersii Skay4041 TaxID=703135 RepID=A0A2A9NF50_9AGAR|nr:hypothetical protein AMATHDRAFT_7881 [Amanita thiersii Skay4041]
MSTASQQSQLTLQQNNTNNIGDALKPKDTLCPGCYTSAIREEGGLVVAFGYAFPQIHQAREFNPLTGQEFFFVYSQSFFHVECFKCAKCHEKVTADTNLLLLSDGSPVCANCTYCCTICHQAINDEAIMAGEDSFHAHCFKCKICKNRIDELTYARTSHGIYCMECHNDRVARNRRHAQKRAELAALGTNGGSGRVREVETRYPQEHGVGKSIPDTFLYLYHNHKGDIRRSYSGHRSISKSQATSALHSDTPNNERTKNRTPPITPASASSLSQKDESLNPSKQRTLPIPSADVKSGYNNRRRSFDDGVRPLDVLFKHTGTNTAGMMTRNSHALQVETSYAPQRRSLNSSGSHPDTIVPLIPTMSPTPTPVQIINQITLNSQMSSNGNSLSEHSDSCVLVSTGPGSPFSVLSPLSTEGSNDGRLNPSMQQSSTGANNAVFVGPNITSVAGEYAEESPSYSPPKQQQQKSYQESDLSSPVRRASFTDSSGAHLAHVRDSRSFSPSCYADVPHGIESETDNEAHGNSVTVDLSDPLLVLPASQGSGEYQYFKHYEPDVSISPDSASEEIELPPLGQASHAAYIAPALPPIRFSMNSADFSELFNSMPGLSPLKSHEFRGRISEHSSTAREALVPYTSIIDTNNPVLSPPNADFLSGVDANKIVNDINMPANLTSSTTPENFADIPPSSLTAPRSDQVTLDHSNTPFPSLPGDSLDATQVVQDESHKNTLNQLKTLVQDAKEKKTLQISLDRRLVELTVEAWELQQTDYTDLKMRFNAIKRTSKRYIEGLTVAQTEYDRELNARRDAEAEITRLRILLSSQAAKLTALSSDSRRQEQRRKVAKEIQDDLLKLEGDLAKLRVERDLIIVEMENLYNAKSSPHSIVIRSFNQGLDNLHMQYQRDLVPLEHQKETLKREILELKSFLDASLEEATVLNSRNEELALLNAEYLRQTEVRSPRGSQHPHHNVVSVNHSNAIEDEINRNKQPESSTPSKKFKWPSYKGRETSQPTIGYDLIKKKARIEHSFTQMSVLRFTRCDRCGDKMWGSQLRCTACNMSVHIRCAVNVYTACVQQGHLAKEENQAQLQSMFGRDLTEQAFVDGKTEGRLVPVLVEKCVGAVEALALDYEGIYRKNGGAGQSRMITQLFEKGDYFAFDLCDSDRFPDICSVTSVLKNYFRSLPVPLFTFDLHDDFINAAQIPDLSTKQQILKQLINKLPPAHYHTLRKLMLHLHNVSDRSEHNRMNSRNLGVVFGPTLMKSRDPAAEFTDMAGKTLLVEWVIENALFIFGDIPL